jgi:hypothetical protein
MRSNVKGKQYIVAFQETYLTDDSTLKWIGNYAYTKADTNHSAGCVTFFQETVRIIEQRDIDDKGHGHLVVVEGLEEGPTIIGNIYAPVKSRGAEQEEFYDRLASLIEQLEIKYLFQEPNLIIMGDFNLPLESDMNPNQADKLRAKNLSEYLNALGLQDCWKSTDDRITQRTGQNRLDRILYRLKLNYSNKLNCDWTFTISDHCLVRLELSIDVKQRTRRIMSIPTDILNEKDTVERIEKGLQEFQTMLDQQWSASMKLEFLKVGLRTVVGEYMKERNKKEREELERIQLELEQKLTKRRYITLRAEEENREEINRLFTERNIIMERKCEAMAEKAKTKWFHEG